MLRYCANLKAIRYESTSLKRILADKSHRVIVAIAIVNFAVLIAISHQKNKGDKLIVHQTFFSSKTGIFFLTFRSS